MRRFFLLIGAFCTVASGLALLLSLPMPGVGWLLAALALTAVSLMTPLIGRGYVLVSLIVSTVHLFTFGPLSILVTEFQLAQVPTFYLLIFVVMPFGIALLSIFLPICCARRENSTVKDK